MLSLGVLILYVSDGWIRRAFHRFTPCTSGTISFTAPPGGNAKWPITFGGKKNTVASITQTSLEVGSWPLRAFKGTLLQSTNLQYPSSIILHCDPFTCDDCDVSRDTWGMRHLLPMCSVWAWIERMKNVATLRFLHYGWQKYHGTSEPIKFIVHFNYSPYFGGDVHRYFHLILTPNIFP